MNLDTLRTLYFGPVSGTKDIPKADSYINLSYKEVYRAHRWEQRKRTGQTTLIPRYTTGTCTVTQFDGSNSSVSKKVTFSGSTLVTSMRGRYFRAIGSSKWSKIINVDMENNLVYLDTEIVDINGSGLSFEIWKRFHYIKSDAEEILDFGKWGNGKLDYNPDMIDRHSDLSTQNSPPSSFSSYGIDPYDDITNTGVLTIAKDSNVATGNATTWLADGYDTGDIVQISGKDYFIKRIESDTRLILFNYFPEAQASVTYAMKKNNPVGFEFYQNTDRFDILPYDYLARPYDLVHPTKDYIGLTDKFIPAIISRAQYYLFKDINDARYLNSLAIYNAELQGLKSKVNVIQPRYSQFSPRIHSRAPGRY